MSLSHQYRVCQPPETTTQMLTPKGRRKQLLSVVLYKSDFRLLGEVFVILESMYGVYHKEAYIFRVLTEMVGDDAFT